MPYKTREDLPPNLQKILPEHAQDIYKDAFNHAYISYSDPATRRGNETLDEVASRVAWSAVKKEYEKNDAGKWVKK